MFSNQRKSETINIPDDFLIDNDNNVTFIYVKQASSKVEGDIEIPEGVVEISNSAFDECTSLTNITIPNSVTSIGNSAFEKCSSLTTITLPENLTTIERMTFYNCAIRDIDITIPNSVTYIGSDAFKSDSNINIIFDPEKMKATGATWGAKKVNGVTL